MLLRHPVRRGPATFDQVTTRVCRSRACTRTRCGSSPTWTARRRGLLGLEGWANTLAVTPAPGVSQAAVQRSLFGRPGVASVQPVAAETREVEQAVDEFTEVITVTETVTLFLALLMAFNSTSISVDERRREFATLFAFGVPVRTGLRVAMVESVITGVRGDAARHRGRGGSGELDDERPARGHPARPRGGRDARAGVGR